jgi:hypothetical protein
VLERRVEEVLVYFFLKQKLKSKGLNFYRLEMDLNTKVYLVLVGVPYNTIELLVKEYFFEKERLISSFPERVCPGHLSFPQPSRPVRENPKYRLLEVWLEIKKYTTTSRV